MRLPRVLSQTHEPHTRRGTFCHATASRSCTMWIVRGTVTKYALSVCGQHGATAKHIDEEEHVVRRNARRVTSGQRAYWSMMIIVLVGSLVALAACGSAAASSSASPTSTQRSGPPGTGMVVRPCVGPYASVGRDGTPASVLSDATTRAAVHVGDLVQVRLPLPTRWTFDGNSGGLLLVQPAPAQDNQLNVCFWNFRAQGPGGTTLHFTGDQLCDPYTRCTPTSRAITFYITVS